MAVIGDSVARALDPGFVDLARRRRWGYLLAANSGCGIAGLLLTTNGVPGPEQVTCRTGRRADPPTAAREQPRPDRHGGPQGVGTARRAGRVGGRAAVAGMDRR